MAKLSTPGVQRLVWNHRALAGADPRPLLWKWATIIEEDNRRGVLAGTDKDGKPMQAVTYRPKLPKGRKRARPWTAAQQAAHLAGKTEPGGNNLSSAQYRRLGGPPLAPRGPGSRVITNLQTAIGWDTAAGTGFAEGRWADVESRKGVPFLMAHFTGAQCGKGHKVKLPVRDLRGVRPLGQRRAFRALQEWGRELVKRLFP
jgi:hypothetical protein